jgi:hypothetical protein
VGPALVTRNLTRGAFGWAQQARIRQSLVQINDLDGDVIQRALKEQARTHRVFQLDAADLRAVAQRTVVRTEAGEVEVEVPDREEEEEEEERVAAEPRTEIRASLQVQAKLLRLGATLGFNIWVAAGDRNRVSELLSDEHRAKLVTTLPLNFDLATMKTIENIDVIWLERRAIAHAFEVEHTTTIYSGLLRMADLLTMQPRIDISLHIVSPLERRDQVRREIVRPVFSVLEGGPMAERCSLLSYEALDELLEQPNLAHMRETIIQDYEEYFDLT